MEQLRSTATQIANAPTQMLSQSQQTSTTTIPRESHAALFAIINKARLLNGWTTRTAQELDPTIKTWFEIFREYGIPITAYDRLYKRAFDFRQHRLSMGQDVQQMDATLLVSQWTGPNGLNNEMRQQQVNERRSLPENAEGACGFCYGTGFRSEMRDGYSYSIKCDHSG